MHAACMPSCEPASTPGQAVPSTCNDWTHQYAVGSSLSAPAEQPGAPWPCSAPDMRSAADPPAQPAMPLPPAAPPLARRALLRRTQEWSLEKRLAAPHCLVILTARTRQPQAGDRERFKLACRLSQLGMPGRACAPACAWASTAWSSRKRCSAPAAAAAASAASPSLRASSASRSVSSARLNPKAACSRRGRRAEVGTAGSRAAGLLLSLPERK